MRTITRLWDGDLRRRSFLVGAGYAVGAFAAPAMRWLTAPTDEPPTSTGTRHVGQADVDAVREVTELFRKLDNRWGGGHPRATVVQYLNDEVLPMLDGHYADAVGRELLAALAELTHLAAWTAFDLEQHGLAQRHMIQALRLARASGDAAFGGEVLAAMSQQALYVDQPARPSTSPAPGSSARGRRVSRRWSANVSSAKHARWPPSGRSKAASRH